LSQPLSANSQTKNIFLVEDAMVITAPVVSFLYVLPGWEASVVTRGRVSVATLLRKGNSGEKYVPAHEVRDAFEKIETIEDVASFFGKFGPMDTQAPVDKHSAREYTLTQVEDDQELVRQMRQMDHQDFFRRKEFPRRWYESSPLQAQLMVGQRPFWSIEAFDVRSAIRHTNYMDHLRKVRAGTCLHCGKLFQLPEKKKQLYCKGDGCQGKAAKRRWNEKRAEEGKHAKA
jgi:hypothetical protein